MLIGLSIIFSSFYPNEHDCENIKLCSVAVTKEAESSFSSLLDTSSFPPRWSCGEWTAFQGWTSIFSDLFIFLSYFGIPAGLLFVFYRTRPNDITFKGLLILFIAFILSCGVTHLIEVIIFWQPIYNLSILAKFITAVISFATLIALIKNTPHILSYSSPEQLQEIIDKQTNELTIKNTVLSKEVEERKKVEAKLTHTLALNKDLHRENQHRIKNNLQMISSLLYIKSSDKDEKEKADFIEIGRRVNSISRIHELLLNKELNSTIIVKDYFIQLGQELLNIHSTKVEFEMDINSDLMFSSDDVINCGLIFSEFFFNAIKHAFKGIQDPAISLNIKERNASAVMFIKDNGIGFNQKDTPEQPGFGLALMESFANNMNGHLSISSDSRGTKLNLIWTI